MLPEDLRRQISIMQILADENLTPNRAGYIPCPFHEEKTASLKIYPEQNTWHCFGCGRGRDVIDWQMHSSGVLFPEAMRILAERFGITATTRYTKQDRQRQALRRRLQEQQAERKRQLELRLAWMNLEADGLRERIRRESDFTVQPFDVETYVRSRVRLTELNYERKEVADAIRNFK